MNIKEISSEKVLVVLENRRTCEFRTVEAAKRMIELINRINSSKIDFLEVFYYQNHKFDIKYTNEYLEKLQNWIEQETKKEFNFEDFKKVRDNCIEFELQNKKIKLLPYALALYVNSEGLTEWRKENIVINSIPKNEEDFKNIFKEL